MRRVTGRPAVNPTDGPYAKSDGRPVIQHRLGNRWIIWNWNASKWDTLKKPFVPVEPRRYPVVKMSGVCQHCGTAFEYLKTSKPRLYCNTDCAKKVQRIQIRQSIQRIREREKRLEALQKS
jgi:hypothetical protein